MMDCDKLVKALRHCMTKEDGITICEPCPYYGKGIECENVLHTDAAAAIEALIGTVGDLQAIRERLEEENDALRLEPKRGEWIWIQKANGGQYKGCSVCHAPIPTDSMLDYLDDEDCEFCYSCGAKMGGTDERRT